MKTQLSVQVHADPDVYKVAVPFMRAAGIARATNCYVIKSSDEALVVDVGGGMRKGLPLLAAALDELRVDRGRAKYFLTHMHPDHVRLLDAIAPFTAEVFVGAAELVETRFVASPQGRREVFDVARENGFDRAEACSYAAYESFQLRASLPSEKRDLRAVFQGDSIKVGDIKLFVIELSGHSFGQVSLHEPCSGLLFSGDHILEGVSPSVALFPHGIDGLGRYIDSLNKVKDVHCCKLLVSHGDLSVAPDERVAQLLSHHEKRMESVVGRAKLNPGLSGRQIIEKLSWGQRRARGMQKDAWRFVTLGSGLVRLRHACARGDLLAEPDNYGNLHYYVEN